MTTHHLRLSKGLKRSMEFVNGISSALKAGRCVRHHDRPEMRRGVGMCEECFGEKSTKRLAQ